MANSTVTFRTDSDLKKQASTLFESLGMNLSVAINLFLRQAVIRQQFPCSLELEIAQKNEASYPKNFFELFGAGKNLISEEEPEELSFALDGRREAL